jgi:MFS family permease
VLRVLHKSGLGIAALVFLTMLPVTGLVPVLKSWVQDRYVLSPFATHLFMAVNMVAAVAVAPFIGAWSDRLGRRRVLIAGAAALDAALFLAFLWAPTYGVLLALRFAEGAAHITVLSLLLAEGSARSAGRESSAMGVLGGALTLGVASGAPLGGALGQRGAGLVLSVGAGVMAAVAVGALVWVGKQGAPRWSCPTMGEIGRLLRSNGALRLPLVFAFVERLAAGFFIASFPIFCAVTWGLGPRMIGLLMAAYMLPMSVCCFPAMRLAKWLPVSGILRWGALAYGVLFAGIGYVGQAWLLPWMVLCGMISAVIFVPTLVLVSRDAPAAAKGAAMGAFNAVGSLGFVVGPVLSGAVAGLAAASLGIQSAYAVVFAVGGGLVCTTALGSLMLDRVLRPESGGAPAHCVSSQQQNGA